MSLYRGLRLCLSTILTHTHGLAHQLADGRPQIVCQHHRGGLLLRRHLHELLGLLRERLDVEAQRPGVHVHRVLVTQPLRQNPFRSLRRLELLLRVLDLRVDVLHHLRVGVALQRRAFSVPAELVGARRAHDALPRLVRQPRCLRLLSLLS